ncbi:MAG: DUF4037 domain-containing protein [Asgard group archaeon]|nr:DUF4037 domain-containing protein [Asgard group archaeon]
MKDFISGLELNKHFYFEAVKPILDKYFPKLIYSSARMGSGSDVLGFDTIRSTDHDWGPRLELFLSEEDFDILKDEISNKLSEELPKEFMGYSTHYRIADDGVKIIDPIKEGNVDHNIEFYTVESFFKERLGKDPFEKISDIHWLTFPEQQLLAVTSGSVYYDGLKDLSIIREKFRYYPQNVWLYLLKQQWFILAEESPYPGRAAEVNDEIGAHILAINQIKKLMKLCFLMEKQYTPYSKWFTSAFSKLNSATTLIPIFKKIINAKEWSEKEKYLTKAYTFIAQMHNDLKITEPIDIKVMTFHNRPYLIINWDDFIDKIDKKIPEDSSLKSLKLGSINQITNETYVLCNLELIDSIYNQYQRD